VEIPSVYLTGDLRELTLYDAATDTERRLRVQCDSLYGDNPASGFGGVIASSRDGSRAFGLYGVHVERGGSVTRPRAGFGYSRHNCRSLGSGPATIRLPSCARSTRKGSSPARTGSRRT
jgi:hypothetical protein